MYQFSYAEVLDETPRGARERERQAIGRSIELLQEADAKGARSREAVDALLFVRRLWGALMEDLSSPDNDLPADLAQRPTLKEFLCSLRGRLNQSLADSLVPAALSAVRPVVLRLSRVRIA